MSASPLFLSVKIVQKQCENRNIFLPSPLSHPSVLHRHNIPVDVNHMNKNMLVYMRTSKEQAPRLKLEDYYKITYNGINNAVLHQLHILRGTDPSDDISLYSIPPSSFIYNIRIKKISSSNYHGIFE